MLSREADQVLGAAASDEDIVARVRAGDVALYEVLVRRYNERLYRVVRSVLGDEDETEDVMQQAYVSAYQHLDQFAGRARFATWLTKIAVHEALARVRRRARVEVPLDEEDVTMASSPVPSPEHQASAGETTRLLERSIDALPPDYRTVFVMREVEQLDTAESAACLGVSEDVVKTRLHRARAMLRRDLFERAGLTKGEVFRFARPRCDRIVARVLERIQ
jgi:RNA polymerase sigma-70 factor (ECF subfamily)